MLHNFEKLSAKNIFNSFYPKTSKRFGQNFLFNESINKKIVSVAGNLDSKVVVEIGPGPGGLTLEILKQNIKKLYLIEYDKNWISVWKELKHFVINQQGNNDNTAVSKLNFEKLEIIHCDALNFDIQSIIPDPPSVIISNLPYNISTQLLFKWFPEFELYEKLVLMFQKEVADRICAQPKTKAYGKLSVLSQWKSKVKKKFDLEPGSFIPSPKVKSSVIEFIPFKTNKENKKEDNIEDFKLFSDFLSECFVHRRKTLEKPLRKYFHDPIKILEEFGYSSKTRAEEISVENYLKIFELYTKTKKLNCLV